MAPLAICLVTQSSRGNKLLFYDKGTSKGKDIIVLDMHVPAIYRLQLSQCQAFGRNISKVIFLIPQMVFPMY